MAEKQKTARRSVPVRETTESGPDGACWAAATGRVVAETCLAEVSAITLTASDRATLQAARAWAKDITDTFAKTPLNGISNSIVFRDGLGPLRSTSIASNGTRNTSEFSGVSAATVTADTFAIPAGYKEEKFGMGRGRGRGGRQ